MTVSSGTRLSHYVIRFQIGSGGMGEVYLAEDERLGRNVALKLLPTGFVNESDRLRRFEQEARSASALNHPNILTIYEVGQAEGTHFIATELVEGVTLRERMAKGKLSVAESLDISTQVASALSAAHQAGIVHRDVKPENIMIRRDGLVKVLDFGLVKLTEQAVASVSTQAPTLTEAFNTDPGVVMGTVRYMSPEQTRGLAVDARTDIWSLGVVLYEMLAGHPAFEGMTTSDLIAAVLTREPTPLAQHMPEIPAQLQRIVRKALTKEIEERYQDIRDLRIDLKNLRRELDLEAEIHGSASPQISASALKNRSSGLTLDPAGGAALQATSSVEYLVDQAKRHRATALLTSLALVSALVTVAYFLFRPAADSPFQNLSITKLTRHGKARYAAISPDGKYVAYVTEEEGRQNLLLRQVATEGDVVIVPPAEVEYQGVTFSHDGTHLYYTIATRGLLKGTTYRVPALSGVSRKIVDNVSSPVALSPNSQRLAFVRDLPSQGESVLVSVNADGTGEKRITQRKKPSFFALEGPAWSPDGKHIACSVINYDPNYHEDLMIVNTEDGSEKQLTVDLWANIGWTAWLAQGQGLVLIGRKKFPDQLWHLSYPAGEARQITNDLTTYRGLNVPAAANTLVTVQSVHISNIWIAPGGNSRRAKQLTHGLGRFDGIDGVTFTPNGQIVYASFAAGERHLWLMEPNGSNQKMLTQNTSSSRAPAVSPDGNYIVFASTRRGGRNIWRMNTDGSNHIQLTKGKLESTPSFSPDGRWVVYSSIDSQYAKQTIWKISVDGGDAVRLNDNFSSHPSVSPDNKFIAWLEMEEDLPLRLAVMPFTEKGPIKTFEIPSSLANTRQPVVRWSPDGRMLTYIDTKDGVSNIWGQPLDGGRPVQLTTFETDEIFWFDWSKDGKNLVLSRGSEASDVILIKGST